MGQLKNLKFLRGTRLDDQEMKEIRGGITCYIYSTSGGSGFEGSGFGGHNYLSSGPCAMSDAEGCTKKCNQTYAYSGLTCFCY